MRWRNAYGKERDLRFAPRQFWRRDEEGLMTDDQHHSQLGFGARSETQNACYSPLNGCSAENAVADLETEAVRLRAVNCDAAQPETFDLARLWHELCSGKRRFLDTFASETRAYALLEQVSGVCERPIQARALTILKRVLLGQSRKVVSIDLRVSRSTVTSAIHTCLAAMGLQCRGSRAPVLLTMAACAALRPQGVPVVGRLCCFDSARNSWVVSVRRPDLHFPARLSNAEVAVVRELLAGHTHAQISDRRATSPRTVANQLATAFRKLGVSGRGEILDQLITYSLQSRSASLGAISEASAARV